MAPLSRFAENAAPIVGIYLEVTALLLSHMRQHPLLELLPMSKHQAPIGDT